MKLALGLMLALGLVFLVAEVKATPTSTARDVSILDYVPAGVTPDGSHLQLALNDVPRVFVPAGTDLVVTNEITVASGKTLHIDGTLTAAASRPANWRMLRVHASADVTIGGRGSLIAGTQANAVYGIWVSGASQRVSISDLYISGFRSGIWSPTDGAWRDDCTISRVRVTGGYIGIAALSWRNGRVDDAYVTGVSHQGINIYNAAGVQVRGGTVSSIGYSASDSAGIIAELAPDATIEGVTIKDVEGHGIRTGNKSHRIAILNNRLSNIGYLNGVITHGSSTAIAAMVGPVGGESYGVSIRGNVIRTAAGYGILVHPGLTASVEANDIEGIGDPGISVLGAKVMVVNNRVHAADGYCIGIGPDPDGGPYQVALAIVSGNMLTGCGLAGIMANGSPAAGVISGNVLSGNGDGIVVQNWTWGGQTFVPAPLVEGNVVQ